MHCPLARRAISCAITEVMAARCVAKRTTSPPPKPAADRDCACFGVCDAGELGSTFVT
jgi:hypothetical protein